MHRSKSWLIDCVICFCIDLSLIYYQTKTPGSAWKHCCPKWLGRVLFRMQKTTLFTNVTKEAGLQMSVYWNIIFTIFGLKYPLLCSIIENKKSIYKYIKFYYIKFGIPRDQLRKKPRNIRLVADANIRNRASTLSSRNSVDSKCQRITIFGNKRKSKVLPNSSRT